MALVALAGCGGTKANTSAPAPATPSAASTHQPAAPAPATPKHRYAPSPGSLPQTHQLPSASTRRFHAEMAALWRGIQAPLLRSAMRAFFPAGAYAQVKAIANPRADYTNRLVHEFRLDLTAAHGLLTLDARLIAVDVPGGSAHWVAPGGCYNRVGYYEVPESRIVFRQGGQVRSIGIASMISWRGSWYVVHLGAVSRSGDRGVVDHPSLGRGSSPASSTC